ncbi:hypothetical protein M0R72_04225 [Candidatus Pacearchaeota archaeon]|nr:hypothetical protein [Candidatus Pacearchaeota archaeon]
MDREGEEKNDLYYSGLCFNTPAEFKRFSKIRMDILETCQEAINMEDDWNKNYVGKRVTESGSEYKGKVEQKEAECKDLISEMKGLMT